jgi:ABC-type Fe3+-hydroxamate transport system substrate-binding protein
MNGKTIAIICAIVVIVVAIAAAALLLNGDSKSGGGDKYTVGEDVKADPLYEKFDVENVENLVFGNANNDGYLNNEDLTLLKQFVAGTKTWSIDANPLADTNADGKVTQEDVDMLQRMLNATSSTEQFEVKYLNYYKRVATSLFPLRGNITVQYNTGYDVAVVLGVLDDVVGTGHGGENHIKGLSETLYPGLKSHLTYIDNDAGDFDAEKILATKTKIVLGDPYGTTDEFASEMKKLDSTCTVLNLPLNRYLNGVDYTQTIITMGVLMGLQANTAKYVEYIKDINTSIDNAIKNAHASSKTYVISFQPSSATNIDLDCVNTMAMQYNDVMNMEKLPVTYALPPVTRYYGGMYTGLEAEYLATKNPEFVILEHYGIAGSDTSLEDFKKKVSPVVDYFSVTNAYMNDKIIVMPFELIGGIHGLATICYIGYLMWGDDYFPEEDAMNKVNYYFQNFTNMGKDIDMSADYHYLPIKCGENQKLNDYTPGA